MSEQNRLPMSMKSFDTLVQALDPPRSFLNEFNSGKVISLRLYQNTPESIGKLCLSFLERIIPNISVLQFSSGKAPPTGGLHDNGAKIQQPH